MNMGGTRVYVGGIPSDTEEPDLERFFKEFGRLGEILIRSGYAFVEFNSSRNAEDAVYEMDNQKLLGVRVRVEMARGSYKGSNHPASSRNSVPLPPKRNRGPIRTPYRLFVENLSSSVSWQDLKDYMRRAGEVTYGEAHKPYRNEGVVEFASHRDLKAAIRKLDGTELRGRRIRLVRDRSRSRSRNRSRSRTRDRSRKRSRSRTRDRSRKRSRSRSRSRSRTRRRSHTRSRSRSHSRSRSPIRTRRRTRSRSRSRSSIRTESRSYTRSRSSTRSRSYTRSRSRAKSRSPSKSC